MISAGAKPRDWKHEWKRVIWHASCQRRAHRRSLVETYILGASTQALSDQHPHPVTDASCQRRNLAMLFGVALLALSRDLATTVDLTNSSYRRALNLCEWLSALALCANSARCLSNTRAPTPSFDAFGPLLALFALMFEAILAGSELAAPGPGASRAVQSVLQLLPVLRAVACSVWTLKTLSRISEEHNKIPSKGVTIRARVGKVAFWSSFSIVAVMVVFLHVSTIPVEIGWSGLGEGGWATPGAAVLLRAQLKAADAQLARLPLIDTKAITQAALDLEAVLRDSGYPLVLLQANGSTIWPRDAESCDADRHVTRGVEVLITGRAVREDGGQWLSEWRAVVEDPTGQRLAAATRWLATLLGSAVLAVSSSCVFNALKVEVVEPMERMMGSMTDVLNDPLKPLVPKALRRCNVSVREVDVVEDSMFNLVSLLQTSFGEAGSKLVRANIATQKPASSVPGQVVLAFFGFCDIRDFTSLTEALQSQVVKLVNGIAQVVHETVHQHHGGPNKSIGDAFFIVWKPSVLGVSETADHALAAFIDCINKVESDPALAKWTERKEVQQRLPGYKVKMGFGLHFGWAVQCAIGSRHKVDVSYLSPNVNMSSRLEAATKQYNVSLLMSGETWALLSPKVRVLCRLIDRVQVVGSCTPVELYTYDVPADLDDAATSTNSGGASPHFARVCSANDTFERLPPATSEEFRERFAVAVDCYLGGEDGSKARWPMARALLEKLLRERPDDGPTNALLAFMDDAKFDVIDVDGNNCWPGYRVLQFK